MIVEGKMQYLFDERGKRYIDVGVLCAAVLRCAVLCRALLSFCALSVRAFSCRALRAECMLLCAERNQVDRAVAEHARPQAPTPN